MKKTINILLLDGSLNKSIQIHELIEKEGILHNYFLADNEKEFLKILKKENIDLIICEFILPGFDGKKALKIIRDDYPEIPFIFISDALGEDAVINAMLNGATDYVLSERLERLGPAIRRAAKEKEIQTKRKLAEEALIASEINYRRLFESAKDGILILDAATGKITDVNPFLINLLGYSREQLIEKAIWEIGSFMDITDNYEKFQELQKKEYVRYENLPLKTTDGRMINVEFVSNVYSVNNIKVIQCNIRDITIRRRAEEELIRQKNKAEASDRLKTAFLNNISHEVRTPLNGILGFGEILMDPYLTSEEKGRYLNILKTSSDRLLNTINDFMDISLIVSGNIEPRLTLFHPKDLLNILSLDHKENAANKKIKLNISNFAGPESIVVNSDMELLRKILSHLIDNAIKFSNQGTIEFGCRNKPGLIEFFVKDQGIGIPTDKHKQIFEYFVHEDLNFTRRTDGSGLGLSIVKGLVELLGGRIHMDSVEGTGSEFYFSIPA
jgi:PAS domain S-box-containing protein